LWIVDITDPAHPNPLGNWYNMQFEEAVSISGNYAYLIGGSPELKIISITNPNNPAMVGQFYTNVYTYCLETTAGYAFLGTLEGLDIVNVFDPTNPSLTDIYNTPSSARGISVSGANIIIANETCLMNLRFAPNAIESEQPIPGEFSLSQNYPNPFNTQTTIQYFLPTQSDVTIDIFDILGCKVETLAKGKKPAGAHHSVWDASGQPSGIYFYKIKAGDKVETKKMVLMK
jgi:hypothetical protein